MEKRRLGRTGLEVTVLGFGTANPDRWRSNADLARRGPLPAEEYEALCARWHAVARPDWTGQA